MLQSMNQIPKENYRKAKCFENLVNEIKKNGFNQFYLTFKIK